MSMHTAILSFNHPGITERSVESALKFFKPDEVTLVHNGSVPQFVERLKERFRNINHRVLSENKGFSGGANEALRCAFKSGAAQVLFLTNDTILAQFQKLEHWAPTIWAPRIEKRKTGKLDSLGAYIELHKGHLAHNHSEELRARSLAYVPGTAFLLNRQAWDLLGGFDESLGTYWEDVDWSLRAHKRGVQILTAPQIKLQHGVGKTCHSDPLYTVYYYQRNRKKVVHRHTTGVQKLSFHLRFSTENLVRLTKYTKRLDFHRASLMLKAIFH